VEHDRGRGILSVADSGGIALVAVMMVAVYSGGGQQFLHLARMLPRYY